MLLTCVYAVTCVSLTCDYAVTSVLLTYGYAVTCMSLTCDYAVTCVSLACGWPGTEQNNNWFMSAEEPHFVPGMYQVIVPAKVSSV